MHVIINSFLDYYSESKITSMEKISNKLSEFETRFRFETHKFYINYQLFYVDWVMNNGWDKFAYFLFEIEIFMAIKYLFHNAYNIYLLLLCIS